MSFTHQHSCLRCIMVSLYTTIRRQLITLNTCITHLLALHIFTMHYRHTHTLIAYSLDTNSEPTFNRYTTTIFSFYIFTTICWEIRIEFYEQKNSRYRFIEIDNLLFIILYILKYVPTFRAM